VKDACAFEYQVASGMTQIGMALVTDEDVDIQQVITELKAEFFGASPKLVARVDEIPRGRSGKPLRRLLAERYSEI
jgi:acyl-coenzyme A synthetase/AMP-(fatty) acid ligase